jgi:cystathionine beta-synthase
VVTPEQTIADAVALMQKYEIEHIPVLQDELMIGSISENGIFQKMFTDRAFSKESIGNALEKPYPVVDFNSPLEKISKLISKESGAVMSRDEGGTLHIVTQYDILQAITK